MNREGDFLPLLACNFLLRLQPRDSDFSGARRVVWVDPSFPLTPYPLLTVGLPVVMCAQRDIMGVVFQPLFAEAIQILLICPLHIFSMYIQILLNKFKHFRGCQTLGAAIQGPVKSLMATVGLSGCL